MSKTRHGPDVRVYALDWNGSAMAPPAAPGWDRLVTVRAGAGLVRLPGRAFAIAPRVGVWIPDETPIAVESRSHVALRVLYLARTTSPLRAHLAHGVVVSPLLAEIIEREVVLGVFRAEVPAQRRLAEAARDEIAALAETTCALPMPRDPLVLEIAEAMLVSMPATTTTAAIARRFTIAERTLERRFIAETGMSIGRWSRAARLLAARGALQSGARVTHVGLDAGYATTSAFIAAYRRTFGVTPSRDA